nr:unnamed protein product [Callosobruchus chinensis]
MEKMSRGRYLVNLAKQTATSNTGDEENTSKLSLGESAPSLSDVSWKTDHNTTIENNLNSSIDEEVLRFVETMENSGSQVGCEISSKHTLEDSKPSNIMEAEVNHEGFLIPISPAINSVIQVAGISNPQAMINPVTPDEDISNSMEIYALKNKTSNRQENKYLRLHGKQYKTWKKNKSQHYVEVDRDERKLKAIHCTHRGSATSTNSSYKCATFSEKQRNKIFKQFWEIPNWDAKRSYEYIRGFVDCRPVLRRRLFLT